MAENFFLETVSLFAMRNEVDCIVLGGSRSTGHNDEDSDYDIYVYLNAPLNIDIRTDILKQTSKYFEINNTFWETEDECTLNDGVDLEIIYRNIQDMDKHLHSVLIDGNASCGYSTCMCYNVFHSKIIHDPHNYYSNLVKKYSFPYPTHLSENIVRKNRVLLEGHMPSYNLQIKKAITKRDLVRVNDRIAQFLASYFDIIFAINKVYHPGEKNLVQRTLDSCDNLPENYGENIQKLLSTNSGEVILQTISDMVTDLDKLIV